jgi:hypothetical protein
VKIRKISIVVTILLCALGSAKADEGLPRVLHAAMFPGVVQLNDGNTTKGLLYMGAEVLLLSMTIDQFTRYYAYSRYTEYLKAEYYDFSSTAEGRQELREEWQRSYDDSQKAKTMGIAFGALAAAWWGWNIVDSYLFPPIAGGSASTGSVSDNLVLTYNGTEAELTYRFDF